MFKYKNNARKIGVPNKKYEDILKNLPIKKDKITRLIENKS